MFPLLCLLLFLAALCGEAIRRHRCYRDGKPGGIPVWLSPVCMIPGIVLLALLPFSLGFPWPVGLPGALIHGALCVRAAVKARRG